MKRRAFIYGSAAAIGSIPSLSFARTKSFRTRVTCLVITDVSPGVSVKRLLALFDVLWEKGLPFTCVLNPFDESGRLMKPSQKISTLLFGYSLQGGGMEVASFVPDLTEKSEYFQGRAVRDANDAVRKVIARYSDMNVRQAYPKVVACHETERPKAPSGIRSAGVSTVLVLPKSDGAVRSEVWPNGTIRVYGGKRVDLSVYSGAEMRVDKNATQRFLYVSAANLRGMPVEAVVARATAMANDLLKSEQIGQNSTQLVSDLPIRDNYRFKRYVAVHLVKPAADDNAAQKAFNAFQEELTTNGIVASVGNHAGVFKSDEDTRYWLPTNNSSQSGTLPVSKDELASVAHDCRTGATELLRDANEALVPGHGLAFGALHEVTSGFDPCAVLWLPCLDVPDQTTAAQISSLLGKTNDVVVSIRPEALIHRFARKTLLNQILAMASDGVTEIVPVQVLGQAVAPQGAEIERQRRTIGALPRIKPRKASKNEVTRQALLEDARVAWEFFEQNTNQSTGLCSVTFNFSASDTSRLLNVTMWDVGSQINGLVAAVQLGLVSRKRFDRNIAQILEQIRGRRTDGRLLPQGWLRVERHRWGNRDFDASDAGRLLSSLENLRRFSNLDDRLGELVGSWDLREIVIDGEIHSVTGGKLHSSYRSHSAHYAARAFRKWGIDVRSPYEVFEGRSAYDDQMALLEAASWIGPLGAEPLLLEALEQGMSQVSSHLADVLFAAQLEDHDETGRLIAVSEGPIDREPWFTYQGLQLDAAERTWALDTVGKEQKYRTPEFWRDNLMISSKAAFLWAAYKPHEYSDKLISFVRSKCRTNHGFASGTFNHSDRVTSTYTDLNTNGVILQAVAKLLSEA